MNTRNRTAAYINLHQQQGAALAVGLILLVVITLLSLSAMRNTNLDSKIAVNHQHKQISFQAAENALAKLTGFEPEDSDSGGTVKVPLTTPGNVRNNPDYYVASAVADQPDSSADLDLTYIEQSVPGQYKFSGFGLSIITLIYDADSYSEIDGSKTNTHNRMQVALVRD